VDYECRLEQAFREGPTLCGVCPYHIDTLPDDAIQQALYSHPAVYISETLSRINPYYIPLGGQASCPRGTDLKEMLEALQLSSDRL
jgi:hypothetical protein